MHTDPAASVAPGRRPRPRAARHRRVTLPLAACALAACSGAPVVAGGGIGLGHAAPKRRPVRRDGETAPPASYLAGRAAIDAGDLRAAAEELRARARRRTRTISSCAGRCSLLLLASWRVRPGAGGRRSAGRRPTPAPIEAVLLLVAWTMPAGRPRTAAPTCCEGWASDGAAGHGPADPARLGRCSAPATSTGHRSVGATRTPTRASTGCGPIIGPRCWTSTGGRATALPMPCAAFRIWPRHPVRVIRTRRRARAGAGDRAGAQKRGRRALPPSRTTASSNGWRGTLRRRAARPDRRPARAGWRDALTGVAEALSSAGGNAAGHGARPPAAFVAPARSARPGCIVARIALDQKNPERGAAGAGPDPAPTARSLVRRPARAPGAAGSEARPTRRSALLQSMAGRGARTGPTR